LNGSLARTAWELSSGLEFPALQDPIENRFQGSRGPTEHSRATGQVLRL